MIFINISYQTPLPLGGGAGGGVTGARYGVYHIKIRIRHFNPVFVFIISYDFCPFPLFFVNLNEI